MTAAGWKLHHVGVAVADLDRAVAVHAKVFGQRLVSGPFVDPIQQVSVCFVRGDDPSEPLIELIAPASEASPIAGYLTKGIGAYHVCYEVDDLEAALAHVRAERCIVVSGPAPAVAFGGRRIAWFFTPTRQLTELVERASSTGASST